MSYATYLDLDRYLEGFATSYYGTLSQVAGTITIDFNTMQNDIDASYNKINSMLSSIQRIPIVPIGTNPKTGSYHPYLIEWNTMDSIYVKLRSRHAIEYGGALPQWMNDFGTRSMRIFDQIANGEIILDTDTSFHGIGYPIKLAGSGIATMYSNWDSGHYTSSDFQRTFRFKIVSTTNGSQIGQAEFKVSQDDGYSYLTDTWVTATNWCDIQSGLNIRWSPGLGTTDQLVIGDIWKVVCTPINILSVGRDTVFKTFGRG